MANSIGVTVPTPGSSAATTTSIPSGTALQSQSQLNAGSDDSAMPQAPPAKKPLVSVFASYQRQQQPKVDAVAPENVTELIESYISYITSDERTWADVKKSYKHFGLIKPLLEHTFCSPATSAAVERVFSQGGLFMRPHRSRLTDTTLCNLMISKCNLSFSG